MAAVLAPAGARLATGDLLRQPELAATLATLAADGPRAFYDGAVGARLVAGLAARGVALEPADLRGYAPEVGPPVRAAALGVEVLASPPNSAGVLLPLTLLALDATGAADPLGDDAGTLAALFRAVGAERDRLLGDPRRSAVGADAFLDPERVAAIARAVHAAAAPSAASPVPPATGDTVAVVAADGEGRAVSLIQSLFHGFGALILEPATGILVQNRGACFTLEPGHPNELAPGVRPAHTLSPTLIERNGHLLGVLGTMGGRAQSQILTHVLLRLLAGAAPQDAVDAPRWLVGAAGVDTDRNRTEASVEPSVREAVERAAGPFAELPDGSDRVGHAQAIWIDGPVAAGSDRRADGAAWVG
jgi:gamma-glutamyltranspeptidase/glutathione hydrolase